MRVGPSLGRSRNPAAHLQIAIGIVRVENRQRYWCADLHVARLDAPLGRVHTQHPVHVIEPYRGHLWCSVRHDRGEVSKGLLVTEQIEKLLRYVGHHRSFLPRVATLQTLKRKCITSPSRTT